MRLGPLDAQHRDLGAKMGSFAGWDMPISYPAGTVAEHLAVRERAGLFDVSHLGKIRVRGDGARAVLDRELTNKMAALAPGRARYSLICNDDGGILDDLIVYALAEDDLLVVPNASNVDAVLQRLQGAGADAEYLEWATLAVQGPMATKIVAAHHPVAADLGYMRVAVDGEAVLSRSGYTGEVGFEVFLPAEHAPRAWSLLLEGVMSVGGEACGLAARDTLRLEMGYPLHGNDIDATTTPYEASLGWAVSPTDRTFVGSAALATKSPARSLIGLKMSDRLIPRRGQSVSKGGKPIGTLTSGTFSPSLKVGIGMAYVERGAVAEGDTVEVDVRGKTGTAVVTEPPFVSSSPR